MVVGPFLLDAFIFGVFFSSSLRLRPVVGCGRPVIHNITCNRAACLPVSAGDRSPFNRVKAVGGLPAGEHKKTSPGDHNQIRLSDRLLLNAIRLWPSTARTDTHRVCETSSPDDSIPVSRTTRIHGDHLASCRFTAGLLPDPGAWQSFIDHARIINSIAV